MDLEKLYTTEELHEAGYGSISKLRKDRVRGVGIPFIYIGTAVRYRESDIAAYVAANSTNSTIGVRTWKGKKRDNQ